MAHPGKALYCALACFLSLLATTAHADRFVLHSGRTVEGDVLDEDERTVTVAPYGMAAAITQRLVKSDVKTWFRAPRDGQPYVVIPVFGTIGVDVTPAALRAGLDKARESKPRYVVLAIDSGGGEVGAMLEMVELLHEASREMRIVAYVKTAYSAAAVIAMSCRDVYMRPGATIGATVVFRMTPDGPADVDAKFRSVLEARMRAINERGGHADLLIRGMSEIDLELYLVKDDAGKPSIGATGPGKLIKGKGQILAMTADEAAEYGLARVAPTMSDLGKQVCGGAWYEVNRRPWTATLAAGELSRKELARQQLAEHQRDAAMRIKPEIDVLTRRAGRLIARAVASERAIADLQRKFDAEIARVRIEYEDAVDFARHQPNPAGAIARAKETADARAADARQYTEANITRLRAEIDTAIVEARLLELRRNELIATIPTE